MFLTMHKVIARGREANASWMPHVEFVFRQQIQPWHPSSTLTHEAAAAVLQLAPQDEQKFWRFSERLFERQDDYFDVNVVNEPRNKTYERLAEIGKLVDIEPKKIYDLLKVSDKPGEDGSLNVGNEVTNDIKQMVKVSSSKVLIPDEED